MAALESDLLNLTPTWTGLSGIDPSKLTVNYHRAADTLTAYWVDPVRPAVSVAISDHAFLRVDPGTQETIGVQIENFLSRVAYEDPQLLLAVAPLAGIKSREVDRIMKRLGIERKQQAAASALGSIFPRVAASV